MILFSSKRRLRPQLLNVNIITSHATKHDNEPLQIIIIYCICFQLTLDNAAYKQQ